MTTYYALKEHDRFEFIMVSGSAKSLSEKMDRTLALHSGNPEATAHRRSAFLRNFDPVRIEIEEIRFSPDTVRTDQPAEDSYSTEAP